MQNSAYIEEAVQCNCSYLKHLHQDCQHTLAAQGVSYLPRVSLPLQLVTGLDRGGKETEENIIIIKVTYINIEFAPSSAECPQMFHGTLQITLHDLTNKITPFMLGVF